MKPNTHWCLLRRKKNELSGLSLGVLSFHVQSSQFITGILTNKIRSVPHWHPEHVCIILLTYRLQYKHCFWDIQFQQATSNTFSFWTLPSFRTIKKKKEKEILAVWFHGATLFQITGFKYYKASSLKKFKVLFELQFKYVTNGSIFLDFSSLTVYFLAKGLRHQCFLKKIVSEGLFWFAEHVFCKN